MKKISFQLLAIVAISVVGSFCITGCIGKKPLKPESRTVGGSLSDAFEVIDKEYEVNEDGVLEVKMIRTNAALPFKLAPGAELLSFYSNPSGKNVQVGFGIEFIDKNGDVIDEIDAKDAAYPDAVSLALLHPGERGSMRFRIKDMPKDATSFMITSAYQDNGGTTVEKERTSSSSSTRRKPVARAPRFTSLPTSGSIEQFAWLAQHRLDYSDISGYSAAELRILRNAIYARHGYAFKSDDLQYYFGNFYDYVPISRSAPNFNSTESANVRFIKMYE